MSDFIAVPMLVGAETIGDFWNKPETERWWAHYVTTGTEATVPAIYHAPYKGGLGWWVWSDGRTRSATSHPTITDGQLIYDESHDGGRTWRKIDLAGTGKTTDGLIMVAVGIGLLYLLGRSK